MPSVRIVHGADYVSVTGDAEFIDWGLKSFYELRETVAALALAAQRDMKHQQLLGELNQTYGAISSLKDKLRIIEMQLKMKR